MWHATLLRASRALVALGTIVTSGCLGERAIAWEAERPADLALAALGPAERPVIEASGEIAEVAGAVPADPAACAGSLRSTAHRGMEHAVWWSARTDARAHLLASRRAGGGAWSAPVAVDTLDRGHVGCARPAPAIAVDSVTGYVSTSYFVEGPEGAGVFYAHSMSDGQTFEWPVAIVYGDRPSETAVAANGGIVAVAYEDPNTPGPRVSVAVSVTDGHRFELRPRPLSGQSLTASAPMVAVRGRQVVVAWSERALGAAPDAAVRMARVGLVPAR